MTGRVISLYIMTFMGATTIGSFTIGIMADHIGAIPTLIFSGIGCLATCLYLFLSVDSIRKRMLVSIRVKRGFKKNLVKELTQ
jgi:uncharacterized membrane protein